MKLTCPFRIAQTPKALPIGKIFGKEEGGEGQAKGDEPMETEASAEHSEMDMEEDC